AKKTRRAHRRTAPPRTAPPQAPPQVRGEVQAPARTAAPAQPAGPARVDFAEEYAYVLSDLKRIAVIAVAMLVVLVALSFVVR
ncbi:MAG: hypothetical protein ACUVST_13325, partial [Anaerolineae bacterium]